MLQKVSIDGFAYKRKKGNLFKKLKSVMISKQFKPF